MPHEVSHSTRLLTQEMNGVASAVQDIIKHACSEKRGQLRLTKDAATLAALIGVISAIRVDGLNEEALLKLARSSVPRDRFAGPM